jgi:hypothetical protein
MADSEAESRKPKMAGGVEELGVEEADRSMAEDRSAVERNLIGFGGLKVKVAQA